MTASTTSCKTRVKRERERGGMGRVTTWCISLTTSKVPVYVSKFDSSLKTESSFRDY